MSTALEYFPPNTGRWFWRAKALNYSPWSCDLSEQMKPKTISHFWPADVRLKVDLLDGTYVWRVDVTDWRYTRHTETGTTATAKDAVSVSESVGEAAFRALVPDWVLMALEAGWRPPLAGGERTR